MYPMILRFLRFLESTLRAAKRWDREMPKIHFQFIGNILSSLDWVQEKLHITWKPCFAAIQISNLYTLIVSDFLAIFLIKTSWLFHWFPPVSSSKGYAVSLPAEPEWQWVAGWSTLGLINSDLPRKHMTNIERSYIMGHSWCLWWAIMRYKQLYNQLDMMVGFVQNKVPPIPMD